jgi:hypothetical protein
MRRRQPPRPRPEAPDPPRRAPRFAGSRRLPLLARYTPPVRPERLPREKPVAPLRLTDPRLRLDRPLYYLLNAEGGICVGQVWQGECVLLFTSPGAAVRFAEAAGVEARPSLVFSRSRSEFLMQARRSFGEGFIGGLIDPTTETGETAFLGFDVDRRQGGP